MIAPALSPILRSASAAGNSADVSQPGRGCSCSPASADAFKCFAASATLRDREATSRRGSSSSRCCRRERTRCSIRRSLVGHVLLLVDLRERRVRLEQRRLELQRVLQVLRGVVVGARLVLEHAALPVPVGQRVVELERLVNLLVGEAEVGRCQIVREPPDVEVVLGAVLVSLDRRAQVPHRLLLEHAPLQHERAAEVMLRVRAVRALLEHLLELDDRVVRLPDGDVAPRRREGAGRDRPDASRAPR